MPRKPKHPCGYPGCPELVEYGQRYCEEHAKLSAKQYEKYGRDQNAKKRYGRAWSRIRARYASAHPLCEECLKNGVFTPVEQVHHIKPLSEGGTHDESNLMSLCAACHARIHAKRGDRWQRH